MLTKKVNKTTTQYFNAYVRKTADWCGEWIDDKKARYELKMAALKITRDRIVAAMLREKKVRFGSHFIVHVTEISKAGDDHSHCGSNRWFGGD